MAERRDLDAMVAAVNAASAQARATWIVLLSLGAYLGVAVRATTHRDLFLESPIALPILGVQLPLVGFYVVAPALFVIMHLYLLVSLYLLGRRIHLFEELLPRRVPFHVDRERVRARLDSFIVLQYSSGQIQATVPWFLQALTVWITVVAAPLVLLLAFQAKFLPYHSEAVTWWHRGLVLVDLALLWTLWPASLHRSGHFGGALAAPFRALGSRLRELNRQPLSRSGWRFPIRKLATAIGSYLASIVVVILSVLVATVPDENVEEWIRNSSWFTKVPVDEIEAWRPPRPEVWWITKELFERPIDFATGASTNGLARNLILPDAKFVDLDDEALAKAERTLTLRGRDLRYAVLINADLRKAEFIVPDLRGARLDGAKLQGAKFRCANRGGKAGNGQESNSNAANPEAQECPKLQHVTLIYAELQGTSFRDAELQGAWLEGARAEGASFYNAQLQGALLQSASLDGANLGSARLQGARLDGAGLRGAYLGEAKLQGASLFRTTLWGADLSQAELQGAYLVHAELQGTSFFLAMLQGALLDSAQLQGSYFDSARLAGATFDRASIWRAELAEPYNSTLLSCRGANVGPMTPESRQAIAAKLESIADGEARKKAQERMQRLLAPHGVVDSRGLLRAWRETSCARYQPTQSDRELAEFLISEVACNEDMIFDGRAAGAIGILHRIIWDRRATALPRPFHAFVANAILESDECEAARKGLTTSEVEEFRRFLDEARPPQEEENSSPPVAGIVPAAPGMPVTFQGPVEAPVSD